MSLFFLMSCPRLSFPSSLLFFACFLLLFFFGWVTDWLHFLFICPYPISFSAAAFHPFLFSILPISCRTTCLESPSYI